MLILGLNSFSQTMLSTKTLFDNVFTYLNRKNFEFVDFADSVKLIVLNDTELVFASYEGKIATVLNLNTIILNYFNYSEFTLSEAKSLEGLRGFIANIVVKGVMRQIYIVLDGEDKIKVVLIK